MIARFKAWRVKTIFILICLGALPAFAQGPWEDYMASQEKMQNSAVVQRRVVDPSRRVQVGLNAGTSERRDFTVTRLASLNLRYHFGPYFGWEVFKATISNAKSSRLLAEVEQRSLYPVDAKKSYFQVSSNAVFTPIYGKYAWFGEAISHFDIYGKTGIGGRKADDWQPFLNLGIGMNNYFKGEHFSLGPEFEVRVYSENRSSQITVVESLFQIGGSWLF